MTLVQTYVTDDRVIMVSDRRLTRTQDGVVEVADDEHTKLVLWKGCFAVGFTGLAFIDAARTRSTSEWIAETLCDQWRVDDGVHVLANGASQWMQRVPSQYSQDDKRLTMVVAGFDFRRDPVVHNVSNVGHGNGTPEEPDLLRAQYLPRRGHHRHRATDTWP